MSDLPDVQSLADLCAEVIGVRTLAPEHNFFDAGGDSVAAARLSVLVEERWGLDLDIFTIIAAPSVTELHDGLVARHARPAAGGAR
jgi:aryl carrier-like protein